MNLDGLRQAHYGLNHVWLICTIFLQVQMTVKEADHGLWQNTHVPAPTDWHD